jgi:hypothetical protein
MSSVMMSTSVSKAMNAFSAEVIRACALKYGFDGEEAMRELSVSVASSEGKKSKAKKETAPKAAARAIPSIPLPFTGVIREDCCLGVKQNHGLYTQCFSAATSAGETGLCKGCSKQASKNASGEPDCGLIAKRVMQGSEYRDAKGRAPVHYTKVMKKQKLTEEQVQTEAAKFGIEIDASHFAAPQAQQKRGRPKKATTSDTDSDASSSAADASGDKKKARGRPKKAAKVVEVNETEDLFASLMQQAQSASPRPSAGGGAAADEMSDVSSNSGSSDAEESDSESKVSKKKTKKSKEESEEELAKKAAKFLAKEEEKEKKAALAQQKAAEKEAEKQKKAAEKEQAQQEKAKKLQEKEAEKAKKEAEKEQAQQEKAKKLAEKEAAKTAKTAKTAKEEKPKKEKASKKKAQAQQEKEQVKPAEPVADLESESEEEEEAEEPVVTVKKFEHEGVTFLKSSDGVLYDAESQEVVGKWNDATKSIDVYDGASDSEEEESDDEDE